MALKRPQSKVSVRLFQENSLLSVRLLFILLHLFHWLLAVFVEAAVFSTLFQFDSQNDV